MKKLIALLLAVVTVLSMCTACGKKETADENVLQESQEQKNEDSKEPIVINFMGALYSDKTEPYIQSVIDAFEAEHENIKINLEIVGWDNIDTRISAMVGAKQAPDLYNGGSVTSYIEDELVYPIEEVVSPELKDDFFPAFWNNNIIPEYDTTFQLPYLASVRALYYNKNIFEEVGIKEPPKTWAEVEEDCAKIKEFYDGEVYAWGIDACLAGNDSNLAYYGWNNGGGYVDENNEYKLDCEENVEAFEWMKHLYDSGYTNQNPTIELRDDLQKLVVADKLAMQITANFFPTLYPDAPLGIAPIPYNDKRVSESSALAVQDCLAVFNESAKEGKDTPEKMAAIREFLDFFYSPEYYVPFMIQEGMLPATQSGAELLAKEDPAKAAYMDALSGAKFQPSNKVNWPDCGQGLNEVVQKILTGMQTPQEALNELQTQLTE